MRIIAGEFRSRRLFTPKDESVTRPMPDRVRESVFGLLRGNVEGAEIIDLFAGTGSVGLEAISRGAARVVFVERDRQIAQILQRNIDSLGVGDRCELVIGDALGPAALSRCPRPAGLVFMDPPYPLVRETIGWKRVRTQFERLIDLLTDDGFAVLRTPWPHFVSEGPAEPETAAHRRSPGGPRRRGRDERKSWRDEGAHDRPERAARARRDDPTPLADADTAAEDLPPDAGPKPGEEQADHTFPNAEGPETHLYHSMGVHFYMKKRAPEPPPAAPQA